MAGVTEQAADADPKIGRRMSVKELKLAMPRLRRRVQAQQIPDGGIVLLGRRWEELGGVDELFQEDWFKEAP